MYYLYALLLSYILLLQRFSLKSQEQLASPQKPRSKGTNKKGRDLGKDLVPWQEGVVGNDPTGRNPRRAAGEGDPARAPVPFVGRREGEAAREEGVNGYGGVGTPPSCS